MIKNYKDLYVWQKAHVLVLEIYKITKNFPHHELFALTSQLRRCSISIVSNIAEGSYRRFPKEYRHFLGIARGSCAELETQILISRDLNYIQSDLYKKISIQIDEISKMLFALQNKL